MGGEAGGSCKQAERRRAAPCICAGRGCNPCPGGPTGAVQQRQATSTQLSQVHAVCCIAKLFPPSPNTAPCNSHSCTTPTWRQVHAVGHIADGPDAGHLRTTGTAGTAGTAQQSWIGQNALAAAAAAAGWEAMQHKQRAHRPSHADIHKKGEQHSWEWCGPHVGVAVLVHLHCPRPFVQGHTRVLRGTGRTSAAQPAGTLGDGGSGGNRSTTARPGARSQGLPPGAPAQAGPQRLLPTPAVQQRRRCKLMGCGTRVCKEGDPATHLQANAAAVGGAACGKHDLRQGGSGGGSMRQRQAAMAQRSRLG